MATRTPPTASERMWRRCPVSNHLFSAPAQIYGVTMKRKLASVLSATGLAGIVAALVRRCCRRGCDPSVGAWTEAPSWAADGRMTNVDVFRTFVNDTRPCWRHYPPAAALAIVGIDPRSDEPLEPVIVQRAPSAGSGEVDITLVFEHEGDDSVAATRYRFTFVDEAFLGGTAGVFRLLEGMREFRCQPGRGHTDWGPDLCL